MRKFYLILFVLVSCFIFNVGINADASDGEENTIDIYLIAGQSNAVGNTDANVDELKKIDTRFESGFEDVLYYGYSDIAAGGSIPKSLAIVPTKLGLGVNNASATYFGPEVGMAEYLSENYENQKFGIIKYASGSSTIYDDIESTNNSLKGNWYSPGVASAMGVSPKNETISGNCYRLFLEMVKSGLEAYKLQGYTPKIKGLAWIQGESEAGNEIYSAKYAILLQALINDIRKDLSDITNENLDELHVVVSKIPTSYKTYAPYADVVRAQQDIVAANDAFVTVLDNDFTLPGALNGTDKNHYSWTDMLELGNNLMNEFYTANIGNSNTLKIKCSEGGISNLSSVTSKKDEIISATLTPNFGYEINQKSLVFKNKDGEVVTDVVYSLKGNFLQIKMPDYSVIIEIEFFKIPQFEVKTNSTNGIIYRTNANRDPFINEKLTFTFVPDEGYKLSTLVVNGNNIDLSELDSSNNYLIYTVVITDNIEVYASFDEVNTTGELNEHEIITPEVGCNGSIYASLVATAVIGMGIIILRKKKNEVK